MEKRLQVQVHRALKVLRKYHEQLISNLLKTEEMRNFLEKKYVCFQEVAWCVNHSVMSNSV